MDGTMPWYKSKIIWGAIISMTGKLLVATGLVTEFAPEDSTMIADTVVLIISGIGDLMAFGARVAQKRAPEITLTKEK